MWGLKAIQSNLQRLMAANVGIIGRLEQLESAPQPDSTPQVTQEYVDTSLRTIDAGFGQLKDQIAEVTAGQKELRIAVSEGIERVDRADRRIKATIARARKELKDRGYEDPGLEAEAHELRVVDGDAGGIVEVPEVPEAVGDVAEAPSSIRGVPASALRQVRGLSQ